MEFSWYVLDYFPNWKVSGSDFNKSKSISDIFKGFYFKYYFFCNNLGTEAPRMHNTGFVNMQN